MADEKEDQNYYFSRFLNFAGWIFSLTLDPSDMISLYKAKKLLKISPFIHDNITAYLSENNAANAIFLAVNLAIVAYQYIYATWFLYLVTSVSGIKKLFKVIFQNPILGIFFYFSFYFRLIGETDKEKFNMVAKAFDLPMHEDFIGSQFLGESIDKIATTLSGEKVYGYKLVLKNLVHKVFSEQIIAAKIEGLPIKIEQVIEYTVRNEDRIIREIDNTPVYISSRTIETQRDLDEFQEYVTKNRREIEKQVKKEVGKKKQSRKLRLQQMVEKKTPEGDVICLDVCKPRIKTAMGCYCEGDCGSTLFIAGSSWCYVDPAKCKKSRYLEKYLGKTYDRCDEKNVSVPKCFTGLRYKDCQIK
jgi:hypothetical protein